MIPVFRTLFLFALFYAGFQMGLISQTTAWALCLLSTLAMEAK